MRYVALVRSDIHERLLLATRKRVLSEVSHRQLLSCFVFIQLMFDVLLYLLCIFSCCVHIVPSTPKLSISILVSQFWKLFVYHQTAFPLRNPMKLDIETLGGISTSMWI